MLYDVEMLSVKPAQNNIETVEEMNVFAEMDANNDGFVEYDEFKSYIFTASPASVIPDEKLYPSFIRDDKNKVR